MPRKKVQPETKPKTPEEARALAESNPERFSFKGGILNDKELAKAREGAGIVTSFNQEKLQPMTSERSRQLHAVRRGKKQIAKMRGKIAAVLEYAKENDLPLEIKDPSTLTDEELIQAEGDADFIISKLFTLAFMRAAKDSKNFRGLSEGYYKVIDQQEEDARNQTAPSGIQITASAEAMSKLLDMIEARQAATLDKARLPEWVSGEVKP
jgi:hypothetical protein